MSRKRNKKQSTLARATPVGMMMPGGATMYIPPNMLQSIFGQTFYGSKAQIPTQDTTMFSPGVPLAPQPGVDKAGKPNLYSFPIAYNSFSIDRSQGKPDIPSFQQLRNLAKLYSGITLCERAWFDMVPRMQLKVSLHPDLVAQGYEEKDYQKEITYFRNWFEKPDGRRDIHTWLRMCLKEQTQVDELYWYKNRTRGGKLLGLHVVAGDTMKPLLNDWGDIPLPDDPKGGWAFQQYPWGIPGMYYSMDMMMHYQESPAADTPYGQSRVERIITEVKQALRKKERDLAMFTEGNIPAGMVEVPDGAGWTPDIIDAYSQSFNAMVAGNPQQQARMLFMQPGMKYTKLDSGEILTDFDMYLLNIACGCYGMSLQDLAFTGDIHKSSGDSQQNVLYRRTIGPLATVYGWQLTNVMHTDFEPSLHGDMFMISFGGFEEAEDLNSLATAYSTLTGAGILGLSNAGKLLKLPEDPDAPHIGRVFMTANGPVFLDDIAQPAMRDAQKEAQLAGYQMAANPPKPEGENDSQEEGQDDDEPSAQPESKGAQSGATDSKESGSAVSRAIVGAATDGHQSSIQSDERAASTDYRRWRTRAIEDVKAGKQQRPFTTTLIPYSVHSYISQCLRACASPNDVRVVFARAQAQESELIGGQPELEYNAKLDIWEPWDTEQQLKVMQAEGTAFLRWTTGVSQSGVCPVCGKNDGVVVPVGQRFPSGHRLPQYRPGCECGVDRLNSEKQVMK